MNYFDKLLFFHFKQRGIETLYWVLNTEAQFCRSEKSRVDGVMTDTPTELKKYLGQ